MNIFLALTLCAIAFYVGYTFGKVKGVDDYHEHLLREGKIHEK